MRSPSWLLSLTCVLALAGCAEEVEPSAANEGQATVDAPEPGASATPDPAGGEPVSTDPIKVAKILQFTGTTVDGEPFDGASLAGRPTVLWFWAPWCSTCRGQIPNVSALGKKYAGEVNVVGIAGLSDDDAGIKDFAGDTSGILNLSDSPGEIWKRFKIVEQSVYTVLDADGTVVSEGYLEDQKLNDLVADLVS